MPSLVKPHQSASFCWVPVAHACNLSYVGGRDQEDHCTKPARENSLWDPISKKTSQKRAGEVAQGVDPEFKAWYYKKEKVQGSALVDQE
jgi:hypothetical protein